MNLSDPRGYSIHISELIQAFKKIGNDVFTVIAGNSSQNNSNGKHQRTVADYVPRKLSETAHSIKDIIYDHRFYFQAKKTLLATSPDVIYARYVAYHQSSVNLSKKYAVPIIVEVNAFVSEREIYYGKRSRRFGRKIEQKIFKNADALVVVSNVLKKGLMKMGIPGSKIHVIPNAADSEKFNPEISAEPIQKKYNLNNKTIVGFVGSIEKRHKIQHLLDAFRASVDKTKNLCLLIVGDGSKRKEYEDYVTKNNLSDHVIFTGSVNFSDIPQYLAAMDIAVIPSTEKHCSPIKLFEYMAMGKAVVAPKINTITEIATHKKDAYIFEEGRVDSLSNVLLYLHKNIGMRKQLGLNARQTIIKNHTWEKNAERTIELFSKIKFR